MPGAWGRVALVLGVALGSALLPVLAAWAAARTGPPADPATTLPLLVSLSSAPVVALLGALGARGLLRWREAIARRPAVAAAAAAAALPGALAGVYLHLVFRAAAAGAPGVPPLLLAFRVDDFVRATPLVPVALLLAAVLGPPVAARGGPLAGILAGFATGLLLALGAGLATAIPVGLAGLTAPPVVFALSGGAVLALALGARAPAPEPGGTPVAAPRRRGPGLD
jgi:hypothetical protein